MGEEVTGGDFVLITLVGGAVGLVAGMFGIGGGFLVVPVLNLVLGLPMQIAVGSAACQVLGPATTSVLARRVTREHLKLPLIITGGLIVGVFAGADVLHWLTSGSEPDDASTRRGEDVILWTYFLLLLGLGSFALWESGRELSMRPVQTGWLASIRLPPSAAIVGMKQPMSIPIASWFGLCVGFLSGLMGISGGLLLLPGLIYLLGVEWHRAVTSSMVIVWLVAAQATVAHSLHDHIRLFVVLGLLLGGTLGARLGVQWSEGLLPVQGRRSFGWLALGTAATIAARLVLR